ncbi:D-hexose-6-phosphate mutarotase [Silvibacterium dinghuense]|uniref:Putative glucose-6-phosphate 1-epimerase n=1 Tax=Silvibacterium dinghuense TaxID=1560006 RepID=A0A4Q1S8Y9_9BACT|nr:D-hexose-6-phosphate mutarotase [Silvibacterium dinghuense]RXS93359.1 D-hexose-6-phosphate mutarotase [Silvibacterium dinghuense]GGH05179.1 D-hexose-6-phosphate mutarotase [Silvibacterium dinghuense]
MSSEQEIEALHEVFAIPGVVEVSPGNGGLARVRITSPAAEAEIYLHGAQVTAWKPAGEDEVIFVSEKSAWVDGKAIRGGIPVCFPWFREKVDDLKAPSHGFVRTKEWELFSVAQTGEDIVVTLTTSSDDASRKWWPHEMRVVHRITVGKELRLELIAVNTGESSFLLEEALHTYYRVGDAEKIRVEGLDGVTYFDNTDGNREKVQQGDVHFTASTDNAYQNTEGRLTLVDPVLKRRIAIEKAHSRSTVVWNPWVEGAAKLADLGDEEWREMTCVEGGNLRICAVPLAPGEQHTLEVTMRVLPEGR